MAAPRLLEVAREAAAVLAARGEALRRGLACRPRNSDLAPSATGTQGRLWLDTPRTALEGHPGASHQLAGR